MSSDSTSSSSTSRSASKIGLAVGLLAIAAAGLRTIATPSIWTHVANGREIVAHGIPTAPTLTDALPANATWVCATWLYDVLTHVAWTLTGAAGLTLLHVAAVLLGFGLLGRTALRAGADAWSLALALAIAAWLLLPGFTPQPVLFALLFLAVFQRGLSCAACWKTCRWALPVVQILWTNIHASFLLGPLLALFHAADSHLAERRGEQRGVPARALAIQAAVLLAATVVNPYLLGLHVHTLGLWMDPSRNLILDAGSLFAVEFSPTLWTWSSYAALAAIAAGFLLIRQRLEVGLAAPAALAAYLIFRSGYLHPISAAMALPFMATALTSVAQVAGRAWQTAAKPAAYAICLGLALLTLLGMPYSRLALLAQPGLGLQADAYPADAAATVLAKPVAADPFLNLAHDGGFLATRLAGRPVYVDDRGELYGAAHYDQLARALVGDDKAMQAIEKARKPGLIVLNATWPFAGTSVRTLVGTGRWALFYFDGSTAILARNTLENAALTKDRELQQAGLRKLEAAREHYAQSLGGLSGNGNAARLIGAGHVFTAMNMHREAEAVYALLTKGTPTMHGAWLALGIERVQLGRYQDALAPLERAVAMRKKDALALLWLGRALDGVDRKDEAREKFEEAKALNPELVKNFFAPAQRPAQRN